MAFERAKDLLEIGEHNRRFVPTDSYSELEEISDPRTLDDDTRASIREQLRKRWYLVAPFGLVLLVFAVFATQFVLTWLPRVVTNRFVQDGLLLAAAVAITRRVVRQRATEQLAHVSELTLDFGDESQTFPGVYLGSFGTDHLFVPYKGRATGGWRPFTIGELNHLLTQHYTNFNQDADSPAIILLRPAFLSVEETERGTKLTQSCGEAGLQPNPWGKRSTVKVTLPEHVRTEQVDELARELEHKERQVLDERRRAERLRRALNRTLDDLERPVTERVRDRLKEHLHFVKAEGHGDGAEEPLREPEDGDFTLTGVGGDGAFTEADAEAVEEEVLDDDE